MNLIVAVDEKWAIGNKNELLIRIPKDQSFFKDSTFGKIVVMGRKTFESFPNGLPLKERLNIILTNDINYQVSNAVVLNCLDDLYDELKKYDTKNIYIIGGESIYKQLLDKCDTAYVTKIYSKFEADSFFPNLDNNTKWEIIYESEKETYSDIEYNFCTYKRMEKIHI